MEGGGELFSCPDRPRFQVLDDKNVRRRFRASNYQSTTRVKPFICTMPMRLDDGWNQIQFNLADFTRRAYGTNYVETLRVQIHANCRIRRVYFSDRLVGWLVGWVGGWVEISSFTAVCRLANGEGKISYRCYWIKVSEESAALFFPPFSPSLVSSLQTWVLS